MKQQSGFTLIELIMVIVILGILAATAMPKFADLAKDARLASLKGAQGAIQSAANMAHGTSLAQGLAANGSVTMEGVTIAMANYYPTASGVVLAANLSANDYTVSAGASPKTISPVGAGTPAFCQISYTDAAANAAPTITLTATSTNC